MGFRRSSDTQKLNRCFYIKGWRRRGQLRREDCRARLSRCLLHDTDKIHLSDPQVEAPPTPIAEITRPTNHRVGNHSPMLNWQS
jgi:hypothetical protein